MNYKVQNPVRNQDFEIMKQAEWKEQNGVKSFNEEMALRNQLKSEISSIDLKLF